MKRKYVWPALMILVVLGLAVILGSVFMNTGKEYSTDLNSLRAQFNQDKGKVRLLLLLSPT
jgi:hypothetical protein